MVQEALAHGTAGAIGAVLSMALLYPLENIRTRLQVQRKQLRESSKPREDQLRYGGSIDCALTVIRTEGWQHLYEGMFAGLVGAFVSSAVYFFWYAAFKRWYLDSTKRRHLDTGANLGIASAAGLVNVLVTIPIWVVQTRMAVPSTSHAHYKSIFDAIEQICKKEGVSALFRGLVPSLILVTNPSIQHTLYEQLSHRLKKRLGRRGLELTAFHQFIVGAVAKAIATFVTYPYQVVKSRQQVSLQGEDDRTSSQVIAQMYRDEGMYSFYQGITAKLSQTVLNAAFLFVAYEKILAIIIRWYLYLQRLQSNAANRQM